MLVLTRKRLESIVVGGPRIFQHMLKINVLEVKRGIVRLGFEAADDIPIYRWEVWERILAAGVPDHPTANTAGPVVSRYLQSIASTKHRAE